MKFSELAYNRPDIAKICENLSALTEKMIAAPDAKTQIELINEKEQLLSDFGNHTNSAFFILGNVELLAIALTLVPKNASEI